MTFPGVRFSPAPASPTGERVNVHVGVQRGRDVDQLDAGALDGRTLRGALALGAEDGPLCGSVRPPQVEWTVS